MARALNGIETLEKLGQSEKLEDLSLRFGLPHVPEYELSYFRKLHNPELLKAYEAADLAIAKSPAAGSLAARGRIRRLLGDLNGAAEDLKAALDLEPNLAAAHAWLGELDLKRPEAEASLSRALELDGKLWWAFLYRAAAFFLKGKTADARKDLETALKLKPKSALGWLLLGRCLEKDGLRPAAMKAYAAAAKANPVCSAAYLLSCRLAPTQRQRASLMRDAYNVSPVLGFITLQIHQTFKVESPAYIRKILRFVFAHPETVGAYYRREATQSHFSHFPAEDYSFVSRLASENRGLAWAHAFFGRAACYTAGGFPEGVRHLTRAIRAAPHAGWFYAWRANARRVTGDFEGALKDFGSSIRLQPYYHRAFVWRGSLYRKMARFPEALADLDRAIAMDPYYSLTYHERSLVRRALGDHAGAAFDLDQAFFLDHRYRWVFKTGSEPSKADLAKGLAELDRAIRANPNVASLRVWRGQLKLEMWDNPAALRDFEQAVTLDPHHVLAHGWYGKGLFDSGQPAAAARYLTRALELEPRFWYAYGWLAEALAATGDVSGAFKTLDRILKEKPKTPWAYYLRAKFELARGRAGDAVKLLDRALLLDGKYPEAYLLMAQARLALGKTASALDAAQRCIEIAPNMGRGYVVRAAVNEKAGRKREVVEDYRKALKDFPYLFNPEQRSSLERLLGEADAVRS